MIIPATVIICAGKGTFDHALILNGRNNNENVRALALPNDSDVYPSNID